MEEELTSLINEMLKEIFEEEVDIKEDSYYWVFLESKLEDVPDNSFSLKELAMYLASCIVLIKYGGYSSEAKETRASYRIGSLSYEGPENSNTENLNKAKQIIKELLKTGKLLGVVNV